MDTRQASHRLRVWRSVGVVVLTVAGCALLLVALQKQGRSQSVVPASRVALRSSSRGGVSAGARQWFAAVVQQPGIITDTFETVVISSTTGVAVPMREPLPGSERVAVSGAAASSTPASATATPPPQQRGIITYTVQAGDNVYLIAQRFGLDQGTIVWANPDLNDDPSLLRVGQPLTILPVDGVLHTVKKGETLLGIAQTYKVDVQKILGFAANEISDPSALRVGQKLIVPGGIMPVAARAPATASASASSATSARKAPPPNSPTICGGHVCVPDSAPAVPINAPAEPGRFIWPATGILTQYFGPWHGGIDIANKQGTPLHAADGGTVIFAAPSGGYGNAVEIDHGDGFVTLYGHMVKILVEVGQQVNKGDVIGLMGTTGHSTGPHVHFAVTYKGGLVNPLDYLPK